MSQLSSGLNQKRSSLLISISELLCWRLSTRRKKATAIVSPWPAHLQATPMYCDAATSSTRSAPPASAALLARLVLAAAAVLTRVILIIATRLAALGLRLFRLPSHFALGCSPRLTRNRVIAILDHVLPAKAACVVSNLCHKNSLQLLCARVGGVRALRTSQCDSGVCSWFACSIIAKGKEYSTA
jgi:hypothetical protein